MLSNVTWGEYLITLIVLVVLYYLFIGYKYYREDIRWILSGNLPKRGQAGQPLAKDDTFEELQAIVNDLKYAVLDKAGKGISKTELLTRLKYRLVNYSGLQKPAFRLAINNWIISHAKEMCGVELTEQELNNNWEA